MKKTNSSDNRYAQAHQKHYQSLENKLSSLDIDSKNAELFLRAFKREETLEVWVKNKADQDWQKLETIPFCKNSGTLGPKLKEGDLQIPEGEYFINRFNPKSHFHLSLGLNYPNAKDLLVADKEQPGSDIFIHGGCQTVGCISITDDKIEKLYVLAELARSNGQHKIPVHIYPIHLSPENLKNISKEFPQHQKFWENLTRQFQETNAMLNQ